MTPIAGGNWMRMRMIVVAIAVLAAPLVFAQSKSQSSKSGKWSHRPPNTTIIALSHPTRVSGDGLSTPSGVKYWDIQTGDGNPAAKGHVVEVLFRAWVEGGKEFDGSTSRDKPTIFTLGVGQVIPGWEEGMEGMKVGGKRQLRIPPELAYGAAGVTPQVPPNSTLIFDVELVGLD
jgi:peptidylprolyl isomerase